MRTIELKVRGHTIRIIRDYSGKTAVLESDLRMCEDEEIESEVAEDSLVYNYAIDGLEALILAHAAAGVDVESPAYVRGIEVALDAIARLA